MFSPRSGAAISRETSETLRKRQICSVGKESNILKRGKTKINENKVYLIVEEQVEISFERNSTNIIVCTLKDYLSALCQEHYTLKRKKTNMELLD